MATSSWRNWSARQRCQPSSSPAAASAAWAWFSSLSSISLPCSFSALRKALAAPALALPWPSAISCSSLPSTSRTACVACARTSGSTFGLAGLAGASAGTPRASLSSSAHTGTGGNGAAASCAAATACASALWNASQTTCSCAREDSSSGGNLASTLAQFGSASRASACCCQAGTSAASDSAAAFASCHDLVDRTSMRCASRTAASRWTCTRCCRSSMPLTRSASWPLMAASGSRLSGAPAFAASRCHARASAMFSFGCARSARAFSDHSAAITSCPLLRLISSSRSRSGRAAPLSRPLSSRKTSCICSGLGLRASHSRTRAARSPEVGAENAPPVRASRARVSLGFSVAWVTACLLSGARPKKGKSAILAAIGAASIPGLAWAQ